nr:MAG TPA: hypothetical protein [Caudoviricetes sp.]
MRQVDYCKLLVWLGLLMLCLAFWVVIIKWRVFLSSVCVVIILIFLIVRKELK